MRLNQGKPYLSIYMVKLAVVALALHLLQNISKVRLDDAIAGFIGPRIHVVAAVASIAASINRRRELFLLLLLG